MKNINLKEQFLLHCAGVDVEILSDCSKAERIKYSVIGSSVLIPAILGFISCFYAILMVFGSNIISFIVASVWAWVIFTIDRAMVINTVKNQLSMGIFVRFLLAIVISFSISEPLIIKLFEDAIVEKKVELIDSKIGEKGIVLNERKLQLSNQSNLEKEKLELLQQQYVAEVDGSGGSKVPQRGPIAEVKKEVFDKANESFLLNESIRNGEIQELERQFQLQANEIRQRNKMGFLSNIQTLGQLASEDLNVLASVWILRMLFLFIELLPIIIKLGSTANSGSYSQLKALNEEYLIQVYKLKIDHSIKFNQIELLSMNECRILDLKANELKLKIEDAGNNYKLTNNYLLQLIENQQSVERKINEQVENHSLRHKIKEKMELNFKKSLEATLRFQI